MTSNAKHRPLVTDGASRLDQLRGTITRHVAQVRCLVTRYRMAIDTASVVAPLAFGEAQR